MKVSSFSSWIFFQIPKFKNILLIFFPSVIMGREVKANDTNAKTKMPALQRTVSARFQEPNPSAILLQTRMPQSQQSHESTGMA
jgi:hypothetical protein